MGDIRAGRRKEIPSGGAPESPAAKISKSDISSLSVSDELFVYLVHLAEGHFPGGCQEPRICLRRARRTWWGPRGHLGRENASGRR